MKVVPRRFGMAGITGAVLAISFPALGDLPPALDRVPANAAVVVTVHHLATFHERISGVAQLLRLHESEVGQGLEMVGMLLETPGLNPNGSVAIAILAGPDGVIDFDADHPPMALIIPLTDFGAFVDTFDGVVDQQIATLDMMGEEVFLRDVGGGWGVLGPDRALVASFDAKAGQMAAHGMRLGTVGGRMAEQNDLLIIADVQAFAPALRQGAQGFADQMEMATMMMGEQGAGMEAMADMVKDGVEDLIRDGQVALLGICLGGVGISFDIGAQFREGSELAGQMQGGGRALELLGRVPDEPFLFAFSMDTSSPAMKAWMKQIAHMSSTMDAEQAQMFGFMDIGKMAEDQEGTAFVMGNPSTILGGALFSKTVQYTECGDPQGMLDMTAKAMETLDGQASGPMSFKTTYAAGSIEIDGVKADAWSMSIKVDPADPEGQSVGPMLAMIFGAPMGPSGYYAAVPKGVVTTFNKNSAFLSQSIKAAQTGKGLSQNATIKTASAFLPDDSVIQVYIGLRELHQHISMFAAMAGVNLGEAPADLGAIAAGASMADGGVHGRLFIPNRLVEFAAELAEKAGAGDVEEPREGGGPRF